MTLQSVAESRKAAIAVFVLGLVSIICHPDVLNLVPKEYSQIALGVSFVLQSLTKSLFGGVS